MNRRKLREQIFKLLFRIEFNPLEEMEEQVELFFEAEENACEEADRTYILEKYEKIVAKKDELDAEINKYAKGWTAERMGKVELTILRLAIYEVQIDDDVPAVVAINEAVELSKTFGQEEAWKLVNGILANFA
jgi:N utilization substance protein B